MSKCLICGKPILSGVEGEEEFAIFGEYTVLWKAVEVNKHG